MLQGFAGDALGIEYLDYNIGLAIAHTSIKFNWCSLCYHCTQEKKHKTTKNDPKLKHFSNTLTNS